MDIIKKIENTILNKDKIDIETLSLIYLMKRARLDKIYFNREINFDKLLLSGNIDEKDIDFFNFIEQGKMIEEKARNELVDNL